MNENRRRIDIVQLFAGVRKRYRILVFTTILGFFGGGIYTYFIKVPTFEVDTQLVVRSLASGGYSATNIQEVDGTLSIINTYDDIIVSPKILNPVIKKLNLNMTAPDLKEKVETTNGSNNNSQVLTLTVDYSDPYKAADIANSVAAEFKKQIPHIMNVTNVTVLSRADGSQHLVPIAPNRQLYTLVSTAIGFGLGILIMVFFSSVDRSLKTTEEVEEVLGLPILGEVSVINILSTVRARRIRFRRKKEASTLINVDDEEKSDE